MRHRRQFAVLISLLLLIAGASLYHKVFNLNLPLLPGQMDDAWAVEAHINFTAEEGVPVRVELPLPENQPGFSRISEDFVTRDFGLTTEQINGERYAIWSVRRSSGAQSLYYRAVFYRDGPASIDSLGAQPLPPATPDYPDPVGPAILSVLDEVRQRSADIETFTRNLLARLNAAEPSEDVRIIRADYQPDSPEWSHQLAHLLAGARIAARPVHGLQMDDGMRRARIQTLLAVHNGQQWLVFDPRTGERRELPEDFLIWHAGTSPLLELSGATRAQVRFSVARHVRPQSELIQALPEVQDSPLTDFSLMGLPVETQNLYRILFTLPVGALLVVFMRNMIGIRTFGTFMPILIALAFIETRLLLGVGLFILLVGTGLLMRFYLERLQLLFVPRIAAVLTLVIMMMALVSIVSNLLGYQQGLVISVFPMVILAMTIERMSVVWEEQGANEAMGQATGSLFTAVLGYLLMTRPQVTHMVFVFPETLLIVLALLLLMGRYTGYRLSELWRFRHALWGRGAQS